jgi:Flp pilus assembly pilin Flp
MLTYYYILAQNYVKDCLKKFCKDQRGLEAVQIILIVGIAAILLIAVLAAGRTWWGIVEEKGGELLGK